MKNTKQGAIYMLETEYTHKTPRILIGIYEEKCVLLMVTSYKKTRDGEYRTYHMNNSLENHSSIFTGGNVFFQRTNKDSEFLLAFDIDGGLDLWCQTDIRNFYFIDKQNLLKLQPKEVVTNNCWANIIDKYKNKNIFSLFQINDPLI